MVEFNTTPTMYLCGSGGGVVFSAPSQDATKMIERHKVI